MTELNDPNNPGFDVHDEAEFKAIQNFDFERAATLLDIMQKVANVAPQATSILGIAQAELDILNNNAKEIARARAEKIRQAQAAKYKKEMEERNAVLEKERQQAEKDDKAHAAAAAARASAPPEPPLPGQPTPAGLVATPRAIPAANVPNEPPTTPSDPSIERRI